MRSLPESAETDPHYYDMVINVSKTGVAGAASLILDYIRNKERGKRRECIMKIAFDVDVLAKQMDINRMVHQVADWGYKYIVTVSTSVGSIRSISIRCFQKNVNRNTDRLLKRLALRFRPLSWCIAGLVRRRNRDSLQLQTGNG